MTRYTSPRTPEMSEGQRALRDRIVDGPRGQAGATLLDSEDRLVGPFGPMLLDPRLGDHLQEIGLGAQGSSHLSPEIRELIILRIAAVRECPFEWNAHLKKARALGVPDELLASMADGDLPPDADPTTTALLGYVQALLDHAELSDDHYDRVTAVGGPEAVFAATVLVGYYELLANLFHAFDLDRPRPDPI
jgi:4-carboxymuconolactone decarboxylase